MAEKAEKRAEKRTKKERKERKESVFKRQELAGSLVEKTGLPRAKAVAAVDAVLETITERLKQAQEVRLVGFGAFVLSKRKAGKGRDPRTGSEIDIAEATSVRFRPSKTLREAVSGKGAPAATPASEDKEAEHDEE
jgi:DNA-binding protein HU-beta